MARRRSLNRRASRRTMNVTELDYDSNIIDSRDPMWWKNIEGDMTVRQSRQTFFGNTTDPILDTESFVETSELRNDWWKALDQTDVNLQRRSSRRKSVRRSESLREFSDSDETNGTGTKKQKLSLRNSGKRNASTGEFSAAPEESNIREQTSFNNIDKTTIHDKDTVETTINTSVNVDSTLNPRPRPFKKRFTKIADTDLQNTIGTTGSVDTNKLSRQEITQEEPSDDENLMELSKTASDTNKLVSISRTPNLPPDTSESETGAKKKRFSLAKKVHKTVSINPHDELIENSYRSEHSDVSHRRLKSREERSSQQGSVGEEADLKKLQDRKRSSTSMIKDPTRERSVSLRIEEPSDKEDEHNLDTSSSSSMMQKILEVSLTRMSEKEIHDRKKHESDDGSKKETNKTTRSLRSSKDIIIDSPYELPDHERSGTSHITDSDNERAKTHRQNSKSRRTLRVSLRSREKYSRGLIDSMNDIPSEKSRINDSRTRIFSDEDISIEDSPYLAKRNEISMRPVEKSMRVARKSTMSNRSSRTIRFNESMSETEVIMPSAPILEPVNIDKNKNSRKTRSSYGNTLANKSQRDNDSDGNLIENESETDDEIDTSNLASNENSRGSRKMIADKSKQNNGAEKIISQGEREHEEEIEEEIHHSRINDKSNITGKNLTTRKSRTITKSYNDGERSKNHSKSAIDTSSRKLQKSIVPRESLHRSEPFVHSEGGSEIEGNTNSMTINNHSTENSAPQVSLRNISLAENVGENETSHPGEINRASGKSYSKGASATSKKSEASNNSRGFSRADESTSEDKNEETEKNLTETNSSLTEKSRKSRKGFTTNKSHRRISSNDDDGEIENDPKNSQEIELQDSQLNEKSRTVRRNLATNKSRQIIESDESISEHEEEIIEKTNVDLTNVRKSGRSFHDNLLQENIREKKTDGERLNGISRRISAARSRSIRQTIDDEDEIDEDDESEEGEKSIGTLGGKSVARSKSIRQTIDDEDKIDEDDESEEGEKSIGTSGGKNVGRSTSIGQHVSDEDEIDEDNEESVANHHSSIQRKTTSNARPSKNTSKNLTTTNRQESSTAAIKNPNTTNPPIVLNQSRNKRFNRSTAITNDTRKQKNITDFFTSKFLQKSNVSSMTETHDTLDKEKFKLAMDEAKEMKKRVLKEMGLDEEASKNDKGTTKQPKESLKKKNLPAKEAAPKKTNKVIDKAYIINGSVYKRPKLPRPKPWVTDRLYRHLWKLMEPKYGLAARVKSEKFILKLSQVVALTIRRKKYESYKFEIDALMKNMARLGIIKTRNDFYDFCYDFLPYDFRVKTTPILLPGNINSIPYDPTTLHTPILEEF